MLDLGSGCGASSIAAKLCGAVHVVANDIDPGMLPRLFLIASNRTFYFSNSDVNNNIAEDPSERL